MKESKIMWTNMLFAMNVTDRIPELSEKVEYSYLNVLHAVQQHL